MKLGVDFDGTIICYAVCAKSDGGDCHTITTTETLDGAKHELQLRINRQLHTRFSGCVVDKIRLIRIQHDASMNPMGS